MPSSSKAPSSAALISRVTSGLKAIEARYLAIPPDQIGLLKSGSKFPSATISPSGEIDFRLCYNDLAMERASSHLKLALAKSHSDLAALFEDVAKALMLLLPGRALSWCISQDFPIRQDLTLGTHAAGTLPVISTIAGRWKKPLTQLSSYFAMTSKAPSCDIWLLADHEMRETLSVHARDLDDAMHLSSFHGGEASSARKPTCNPHGRVMRAVEQFSAQPVFEALDAAATAMYPKIEQMHDAWNAETQADVAALVAAAERLDTEMSLSYSADLLAKTSRLETTDHPLIHPDDQDVAKTHRTATFAALEDLLARLMMQILKVHPALHEARLSWSRSATTRNQRGNMEIKLTLDGVALDLGLSDLSRALLLASHLAIATKPGPWQLFGIASDFPRNRWLSGAKTSFEYMMASCPSHAALIYNYRKRKESSYWGQPKFPDPKNLRGFLLEPIRNHEVQTAQIKLKTSKDLIYP